MGGGVRRRKERTRVGQSSLNLRGSNDVRKESSRVHKGVETITYTLPSNFRYNVCPDALMDSEQILSVCGHIYVCKPFPSSSIGFTKHGDFPFFE